MRCELVGLGRSAASRTKRAMHSALSSAAPRGTRSRAGQREGGPLGQSAAKAVALSNQCRGAHRSRPRTSTFLGSSRVPTTLLHASERRSWATCGGLGSSEDQGRPSPNQGVNGLEAKQSKHHSMSERSREMSGATNLALELFQPAVTREAMRAVIAPGTAEQP